MDLAHGDIYLDANIIIYLVEGNPTVAPSLTIVRLADLDTALTNWTVT